MEISIAAEKLFSLGGFPVTNALVMAVLIGFGLAFFAARASRRFQDVPKGFQNLFEIALEFLLDLVESVTQDRKQALRFFPLVATIFLFVLLVNWIELLPGLGTVGLAHHAGEQAGIIPFVRSTSADLNFTLALSLITVFTVQFTGIAALGVRRYAGRFFVNPFHKPYFIGSLVGILELVSEFGKIISFTFRLFGNIFAGEVLLIVMLHLVPYLLPLPFLFLEIFVGLIQAVVFAMLALVFLKTATVEFEH
jgi:F-type H+-transporting ATPase subunit a